MIKKNFYEKIMSLIKDIIRKDTIKKTKKIKLDILGISYTKSGDQTLYIVVLGEENGLRKIPVIINYYEAQSIAIEVEKISPIVPLIYDALKEILTDNNIIFDVILIDDFKNDILSTYIISKKEKVEIRTADALSISIRMGYPIFIYDNILNDVYEKSQKSYDIKDGKLLLPEENKLNSYNVIELDNLLQSAIDREDYEKASEIRDEIIKKKKEN